MQIAWIARRKGLDAARSNPKSGGCFSYRKQKSTENGLGECVPPFLEALSRDWSLSFPQKASLLYSIAKHTSEKNPSPVRTCLWFTEQLRLPIAQKCGGQVSRLPWNEWKLSSGYHDYTAASSKPFRRCSCSVESYHTLILHIHTLLHTLHTHLPSTICKPTHVSSICDVFACCRYRGLSCMNSKQGSSMTI